ncbi:MAG: CBS domain-containing protein [bacterium]|nr:CBS domain-containing protein [bacterium]
MGVCAKDVMTTRLVSVRADMRVDELVETLQQHDITGAPVVDAEHKLVGVVSMTDIILNDETFGEGPVMESDYQKQPDLENWSPWEEFDVDEVRHMHVQDIMSPEVISATPNTPLHELAGSMYTHQIHRIVIVDETRICGIVSTMDIIRAVMQEKVR